LKPKSKELFVYDKKIKIYAVLNGSRESTKNEQGQATNYPILGIATGILKPLSKINGINVGTELYHNFSYRQELQNQALNQSAFVGGLQLGHHFSLGKVYFLQQMGIYLLRPKAMEQDLLYQRYSLWYKFSEKWFAGVSLLSHGHVADYIDLRIGIVL